MGLSSMSKRILLPPHHQGVHARLRRAMGKGGGAEPTLTAIISAAVFACACAAAWAQPAPTPPPPPAKMTIGFVEIEGDARHEPVRADRVVLKTRDHPFAGAQVGVDETTSLVRVLRTEFKLERVAVKSAAEVAPAVTKALEGGINFFVLDTPAESFKPLAAAVKGRDVLLFNATAPEDALRREVCAREIVHTLPSQAMLSDALLQHLAFRKWRN